MQGVILRALKLAGLLNLPPLLLLASTWLELEIFPLIVATGLWFNIPLQYLGMASFFDNAQLTVNAWGTSSADPSVLIIVVLFWLVTATVISYVSLLRISRTARD